MSDKLFYSRVGKIFTLIVQLAVVLGGLVCVATRFVPWYFSPDESETKKKKDALK